MLTKGKVFKMTVVSRISELRGLYRKCSQHKDNKTPYFEASFFSSGNLSAQTIE
jgi:hypothetical protein